mgnify:CR=1 FL=1
MTNQEEKIQKALGTYLPKKWKERNILHAEGKKLIAKGDNLYTEYKLCIGGYKLIAEGRKLCIEGDDLFVNAVIEVYGPKAIIDWNTGEVTLAPIIGTEDD